MKQCCWEDVNGEFDPDGTGDISGSSKILNIHDATVLPIGRKIYTARRHASAVNAVVMHVSVCLSVRHTPLLYQNG